MRIHGGIRPVFCFLVLATWAAAQQPLFAPAPGSPFQVGGQTNDVFLADVNGDGNPDILVATRTSVAVLLGNGGGGFRAAAGSPVKVGPGLIVTGDFNGDGKLDVAATGHDSNNVDVLLGDGRGSFTPAPGSPFAFFGDIKAHNHGLAVGDLNGDGKLDLTMGHQETGEIAVLLGEGNGRFHPATGSPFKLGRGFYPHTLADVNGDGRLDLIAPDLLGGTIVVALGNGRGGFTAAPGSPIRVLPRPYSVLLADFNSDGKLDLAVAHDDIRDVTVLLGIGGGSFAPPRTFAADRRGAKMAAPDLNRDGRPDLVIGGGGVAMVFYGDGQGGFRPVPGSPYHAGRGAWGMAVGDVNRDGKPDIITANFEDGTVSVLLGR